MLKQGNGERSIILLRISQGNKLYDHKFGFNIHKVWRKVFFLDTHKFMWHNDSLRFFTYPRLWHTACPGKDSDVIVFGGSCDYILLVDTVSMKAKLKLFLKFFIINKILNIILEALCRDPQIKLQVTFVLWLDSKTTLVLFALYCFHKYCSESSLQCANFLIIYNSVTAHDAHL